MAHELYTQIILRHARTRESASIFLLSHDVLDQIVILASAVCRGGDEIVIIGHLDIHPVEWPRNRWRWIVPRDVASVRRRACMLELNRAL